MHQYTLPKTERLYLRESISELFAKGSSFTAFPYRVVYLFKEETKASVTDEQSISDESIDDVKQIPADTKQGRCAIMTVAPKKRFKHAVDRNHVKRLTREAYRLQKLPLIANLEAKHLRMEVAFLYVDNKQITFQETHDIIGRAINRLIRIIQSSEGNVSASTTTK